MAFFLKFATASSVIVALISIIIAIILQYKNYDRLHIVPESATSIDNNFYDTSIEWWDPKGQLYGLLLITPVRVNYFINAVHQNLNIDKPLKLLEIGCGGGFVTEAFAKVGFQVTGLDLSPNSIKQAKAHANSSGLHIRYISGNALSLPSELKDEEFDIIVMADVLEHLHDIPLAVTQINRVLKKGGMFCFDTVNRNWKSYVFLILILQDLGITGMMPPHTHDWSLFITPQELTTALQRQNIHVADIKGISPKISFETLNQIMNLDPEILSISDDTSLQYIGYALKNR